MKGGLGPVIIKMTGGSQFLQGVDGGGVKTRAEPPGVWVTDRETQLPARAWGLKRGMLTGRFFVNGFDQLGSDRDSSGR